MGDPTTPFVLWNLQPEEVDIVRGGDGGGEGGGGGGEGEGGGGGEGGWW